MNTLDIETTGYVYSYSNAALVLQIPTITATSESYNYKVLRVSHVKSLEVLSKTIDDSQVVKITKIDPDTIEQVEKRNAEAADLLKRTRNENVSKEGQQVFNAVYKTVPNVRWSGDSIIVLDEVKISSPYNIKNIKSLSEDDKSDAIELVKKIVDGVWNKIESESKGG